MKIKISKKLLLSFITVFGLIGCSSSNIKEVTVGDANAKLFDINCKNEDMKFSVNSNLVRKYKISSSKWYSREELVEELLQTGSRLLSEKQATQILKMGQSVCN